jgi:hypothetical protein
MPFLVGLVAGIPALPLDSFFIAEMHDEISIQEAEQNLQLFNALSCFTGPQKTIEMRQQLPVLAVGLYNSDEK